VSVLGTDFDDICTQDRRRGRAKVERTRLWRTSTRRHELVSPCIPGTRRNKTLRQDAPKCVLVSIPVPCGAISLFFSFSFCLDAVSRRVASPLVLSPFSSSLFPFLPPPSYLARLQPSHEFFLVFSILLPCALLFHFGSLWYMTFDDLKLV